MNLLKILIIVTIIFIIYVEYSVGGILIRSNSLGYKSINLKSLLNFMIHPLHNRFLWNIRSLDINYPFILIISTSIYKIIKQCV